MALRVAGQPGRGERVARLGGVHVVEEHRGERTATETLWVGRIGGQADLGPLGHLTVEREVRPDCRGTAQIGVTSVVLDSGRASSSSAQPNSSNRIDIAANQTSATTSSAPLSRSPAASNVSSAVRRFDHSTSSTRHTSGSAGLKNRRLSRRAQLEVVGGVTVPDRGVSVACLDQLVGGELAEGLEHPKSLMAFDLVAARSSTCRAAPSPAPVRHRHSTSASSPQIASARRKVESTGEHAQPREQRRLGRAEQVVRPTHGVAQRLVPSSPRTPRSSTSRPSRRRSAISTGVISRIRAAASSIASGMPSRRRATSRTAASFAGFSSNRCSGDAARSTNSSTPSVSAVERCHDDLLLVGHAECLAAGRQHVDAYRRRAVA